MLLIILWAVSLIWLSAGFLSYGMNKYVSTYAILLGRQWGDTMPPYTWKDDLLCVSNIFLGPMGFLGSLLSIQELRGQATLTEWALQMDLDSSRHLIGNEQLLQTITRAKSSGFRLSVPHECRQQALKSISRGRRVTTGFFH